MSGDVHQHFYSDPTVRRKLDRIERMLTVLLRQGDIMAGELEALQAQVEKNTEVDQSAIALLNGLSTQITALKNDPVKLQAFADSLRASSQSLADAVVANTPAEDGGTGGGGTGGTPPAGGGTGGGDTPA